MEINPEKLRQRTKTFGLNIIRLLKDLPRNGASEVIGKQLLRSATSVGANYRAACRARSTAEFISRISVVEEESDESGFWLELLQETEPGWIGMQELLKEANELTAIFVSTGRTAKARLRNNPKSPIQNPKSS